MQQPTPDLAEIKTADNIKSVKVTKGKISHAEYQEGTNGKKCTFDGTITRYLDYA